MSPKRCILHFGRALFTRLKQLRLTPFFISDPGLENFFFKIYWLCLVPEKAIHSLYREEWENKPALHGIQEFCDFFMDRFFKAIYPKGFPIEFWNRFGQLDFLMVHSSVLTDKKLAQYINSPNPDILKVIECC